MRILDKYLLRSYLVPVAYCLFGFSMMFIIFDLFGDISKLLEASVAAEKVVLFYLCLLAPTIEYIAPASLLLATLYALWRLSKNNELIAMRASGLSFGRIMLPFLLVGLVFSIGSALIKEFVTPAAAAWSETFRDSLSKRPRNNIQSNTPYYNIRDRRLWIVDRFDTDHPGVLIGVKATEERPDGTRIRELTARQASYLDGQWWLFDPLIQLYDERDNPVGRPSAAVPGRETVLEMTEFSEKPIDFVNEVRSWDLLSSLEMWEYIQRHPGLSREALAQKMTVLHSRLAMPWACLVVTLFALPAGARTGRQNALIGVFKAVAFFFAFYAITQLGLFMGMRRIIAPWLAAWLPNFTFLTAGCFHIVKMR